VLNRLARSGADVRYHDPYVPEVAIGGERLWSQELSPEVLALHDCVVVLTAHSDVDYNQVVSHAPLVFDARGINWSHPAGNLERL